MNRRVKQAAVVFVIALAAAQLARPERANPATDPSQAIGAHVGAGSGLVAVLDRACNDCHSNKTAWRWYTRIAPVSWLYARGVTEGRAAVNFSEWAAYRPDRQRRLLTESCRNASTGKMPGPYSLVRPETRLSAKDIDVICTAARQAEAAAAHGF